MPGPWDNYAHQAAAADPAAPGAAPWQKYAAPVDMRPSQAVSAPAQPVEQQGMFRSFYNSAIAPVVDMVKDTYARGDMGEKAAGDILDAFKEQVKHFAGHPDIRNLPAVGPGATETAARMQKQYDAGNYSGMIGSAAGFIAPFAAPEVLARAPEAPGAIADAAKAGAQKLRNAIPEGPPISGAAADAVGLVSPRVAHAIALANRGAKVLDAVLGPKTAQAAALTPGEQTVADMRAQIAAKDAENAAAASQDAAYDRTGQAAFTRNLQQRLDEANPPRESAPLPAAAAAPEPAGPWQKYAAPAEVAPESPATPAQAIAAPVPQKIPLTRSMNESGDDAAVRIRKAHEAEDIEWANRARKADRFVKELKQSNLDPTPQNLAKAARWLDESAPSDETVPMIHDRMKFTEPAKVEALPPEEPASDLEQQLRDSLAAGAAKKAAPAPTGFAADAKAAFDAAKTRRRKKP